MPREPYPHTPRNAGRPATTTGLGHKRKPLNPDRRHESHTTAQTDTEKRPATTTRTAHATSVLKPELKPKSLTDPVDRHKRRSMNETPNEHPTNHDQNRAKETERPPPKKICPSAHLSSLGPWLHPAHRKTESKTGESRRCVSSYISDEAEPERAVIKRVVRIWLAKPEKRKRKGNKSRAGGKIFFSGLKGRSLGRGKVRDLMSRAQGLRLRVFVLV